MADMHKKLLAAQFLKKETLSRAKTGDPVLVVVPHVPTPDRIPEDRSIEMLIHQLRKHFRVVVAADRPAPLEDTYRRSLLMEGVEIVGGHPNYPPDQPVFDPKPEMHKTPFRAVFIVGHQMAELHLRDLTLFSPHTPFVLFFPNVRHLKQLRMENQTLKRLKKKNLWQDLYRLVNRIVVVSRDDADSIQKEVSLFFHPDVMPGPTDGGAADWLRGLVRTMPPRREASGAKKLVSIVILCHNDLRYLKDCVQSIKQYTHVPYELIFVDNASEDGSQKYLRSVKSAKVIVNPVNLAFAKGNNQGFDVARGDYLMMLNADVLVTPGWLEKMVACAESDPSVGLVGPCTNNATHVQAIPVGYKSIKDLNRFALANAIKHDAQWEDVHRLIGFCLLIRREVLQKVGVLDERFGPGGYEDYDYCLRVQQAGYKIKLCKDVYIHHFGGKGYVGMDYDRLREVNREIFIDKWCRKSLEFLEQIRL
jgi:GT2 family glycosyltransferase